MAKKSQENLSKDEQSKKEIKRLKKLFSAVDDEKKKVSFELIERLAFMTLTLRTLEAEINEKGPVIEFKNGSQKMRIENPAQKSYNTMINRYTTAFEKLTNLLPKSAEKPPQMDDFDDFVGGRGD